MTSWPALLGRHHRDRDAAGALLATMAGASALRAGPGDRRCSRGRDRALDDGPGLAQVLDDPGLDDHRWPGLDEAVGLDVGRSCMAGAVRALGRCEPSTGRRTASSAAVALLADGPELGGELGEGIELGRVTGAARRWLVLAQVLDVARVLARLPRPWSRARPGLDDGRRYELGAVVEIEGIEPERWRAPGARR